MNDAFTPEESAQFDAMRAADPAPAPAPAPEPSAAPEPESEVTSSAPEQQADQVKTVPHAALHEERERRKALEQQMQQQQARFDQLLARLTPPTPPAATAPAPVAFEQDPQAYIQTQFKTQADELAALRQWREQQEQQAQSQRQYQALVQHASVQEREYRATAPDYDAAVAHLIQSRDQELQLLGVSDPALRQQTIAQDRIALAHQAATTGQNVAEWVYKAAQLRGYAPKPAPADANKALETVARGQALSVGIGSQGAAPPARLDARAIAALSPAEFEALNKRDPAAIRRALGG